VGGSTFTLTNSGLFGDEFGTPIINQPESAILAIGALKKEPVVLTDSEGNDTIAIRSMQFFCLGFDHRLIDGADAGKFMSEFKRGLETWDRAIG
jgi:pyruvate dehydrogenase E2 component (dihydrolipoamide acetyltransferase)